MENGILTEGRVQYITLHLPDSFELIIINTYAPRHPYPLGIGPPCGKG
jgi:hypothetical protein